MTKQTKYNTTGLTRYFEALTQSRYNPKINASNELLRKRQEFCFGIKERKKERWKSLWNAFTWENITHLSLRPSFYFLFFLNPFDPVFVFINRDNSNYSNYKLFLYRVFFFFFLWFTHSCSLSISGVVGKAESSSPALFFSLKHVSCVCVHQQSSWLTKKANKLLRIEV